MRMRELIDIFEGVSPNAFLHGGCWEYALAIHERTGFPLVVTAYDKHCVADGQGVYHAGVKQGTNAYLDVRGRVDRKTFANGHKIFMISEEQLKLIAQNGEGIDEEMLATARELISTDPANIETGYLT